MRVETLKRGEEAGTIRAMVSKFHIVPERQTAAVCRESSVPSSDIAENSNLRQQLNNHSVVDLVK